MKIKRYPGKAVDASLSLDATNVMGVLYEANWQNFANATATNSNNGSTNNKGSNHWDGASTLGKYQMTLEQVRAREMQTKDDRIVWAIKDLNGYKPSTLRRKPRKLNCDWDNPADDDDDDDNNKNKTMETINNNNKYNTTNHYVADPTDKRFSRPRQQVSVQPPILKRAQTMAARPPPIDYNSTLDIKDLRKQWRAERAAKTNSCSQATQSSPTAKLPLENCDNNSSLNQPVPKPRNSANINRAKSVRFPRSRTPPKPPPRTVTLIGKEPTNKSTITVKSPTQKPSIEPLAESLNNLSFSRNPLQTRRRQVDSASSTNSTSQSSSAESDQFSIPRPRLIVPVHTYARKRKTGNLQDQDMEVSTPNDQLNTNNGKS